jgi:hypothetical protein
VHADGGNEMVTVRMTFENGETIPEAGDTINILIDPKNSSNILVVPDKA